MFSKQLKEKMLTKHEIENKSGEKIQDTTKARKMISFFAVICLCETLKCLTKYSKNNIRTDHLHSIRL